MNCLDALVKPWVIYAVVFMPHKIFVELRQPEYDAFAKADECLRVVTQQTDRQGFAAVHNHGGRSRKQKPICLNLPDEVGNTQQEFILSLFGDGILAKPLGKASTQIISFLQGEEHEPRNGFNRAVRIGVDHRCFLERLQTYLVQQRHSPSTQNVSFKNWDVIKSRIACLLAQTTPQALAAFLNRSQHTLSDIRLSYTLT